MLKFENTKSMFSLDSGNKKYIWDIFEMSRKNVVKIYTFLL